MLKIIDCLIKENGYVLKEDLLDYISKEMSIKTKSLSRTLERDFLLINEVFGIKIKHKEPYGYYFEKYGHLSEEYMRNLLQVQAHKDENPLILGEKWKKCVLPDLSLTSTNVLHDIAWAIEWKLSLEFDYADPVHKGKVIRKKTQPHNLKEFQRWYMISCDKDDKVESFDMSRMYNTEVCFHNSFRRNNSIDIPKAMDERICICEHCGLPYIKGD